MDRSELEKQLAVCVAQLAERALLSLVEVAQRVVAGDRNGASRRAEEAARRQKLQSAADLAANRVKLAEKEVQAKLERRRVAAVEAAKAGKAAKELEAKEKAKGQPKKGDEPKTADDKSKKPPAGAKAPAG